MTDSTVLKQIIDVKLMQLKEGGDLAQGVLGLKLLLIAEPDFVPSLELCRDVYSLNLIEEAVSLVRNRYVILGGDEQSQSMRIRWAFRYPIVKMLPDGSLKRRYNETLRLQELIGEGNLEEAVEYMGREELACNSQYFPFFEAARATVEFKQGRPISDFLFCINISEVFERDPRLKSRFGSSRGFLEEMGRTVKWKPFITKDTVDGKMYNGVIIDEAQECMGVFVTSILPVLQNYYKKFAESGSFFRYFKRNADPDEKLKWVFDGQLNSFSSGQPLKDHIHTGTHSPEHERFPEFSCIFYPLDIAEDEEKKSGYLRIGRPSFDIPDSWDRSVLVRPRSGDFMMFPAFLYHGIMPVEQGPRYSLNFDVNMDK